MATPPTLLSEPNGACVINSEALRSCHGWMFCFNFPMSKPLGARQGSSQGALRSQKRMVSPPNIISPEGERIKYFPKPVGAPHP